MQSDAKRERENQAFISMKIIMIYSNAWVRKSETKKEEEEEKTNWESITEHDVRICDKNNILYEINILFKVNTKKQFRYNMNNYETLYFLS